MKTRREKSKSMNDLEDFERGVERRAATLRFKYSVYLILAVSVFLCILFSAIHLWGGDTVRMEAFELQFVGLEVDEGDTVKIRVRSADESLTVFGTNSNMGLQHPPEYLTGMRWELPAHDAVVVEYEAPNAGRWGVVIMTDALPSNVYIQFLEPEDQAHWVYTWGPIKLSAFLLALAFVASFSFWRCRVSRSLSGRSEGNSLSP